jgi:hypothetical protein
MDVNRIWMKAVPGSGGFKRINRIPENSQRGLDKLPLTAHDTRMAWHLFELEHTADPMLYEFYYHYVDLA